MVSEKMKKQVIGDAIKAIQEMDGQGGYNYLYYNHEKHELFWETGDWFDEKEVRRIKDKLIDIIGRNRGEYQRVQVESEGKPPRAEGWVCVYPEKHAKVYNRPVAEGMSVDQVIDWLVF